MQHLARVSLQRSEEGAVSIHNNEAELVVVSEERCQGFGVEFVVAQIERGVDRFERFEIDVDLLFFALISNDGATVNDEAVRGH